LARLVPAPVRNLERFEFGSGSVTPPPSQILQNNYLAERRPSAGHAGTHGKNRRENPAGGLFGNLQKLSNTLILLVIFRPPGGMKLA
jgi:hypothetical protein